ncbi:MAG: PA14 domain-containing protein [Cytophagales bacterium]|nr:PA14 domain-containing protein [Cytophagales bacterium]
MCLEFAPVLPVSSYLKIDRPGDYRFYLASDDGSKLYINRRIVVDNDGDHGVLERSGDIKLKAGLALLEVEYFNKSGGTWLDAYYKGPGIPKQIIPADRLFLTKANS